MTTPAPENIIERKSIGHLDRLGACVSAACAVHCILLPLVITLLPLMGLGFIASSGFEVGMIVIAVSLAAFSLCWGHRVHGRRIAWILFCAALILFFAAHTYEHDAHWLLMGFGGFALAGGHMLNIYLCRTCPDCTCDH